MRLLLLLVLLYSVPGYAQLKDSVQRYFDQQLSGLPEDSLLTPGRLDSIRMYNHQSGNRYFNLFLRRPREVDRVAGYPGYAQGYVDYIIAKEQIDPHFPLPATSTVTPPWSLMNRNIRQKYGRKYADRTVLNAQVRWYSYTKDSVALATCYYRQMHTYGIDTAGLGKLIINNNIYYYIFLHSGNRQYLQEATGWMKVLVDSEPGNVAFLDTYANLLYKTGQRQPALDWEKKAVGLDPRNVDVLDNWSKMQKGIPTWRTQKK